jgi:hypothetical protein
MTKSTRPTVSIHNAETDKIIDRIMNDAEFAQYEADQAAHALAQTEAESKAARRAEILEKLGLTNDEAQLLLG